MSKPKIATKNLGGLTELMIAENVQYKKCLAYANQVGDKGLQDALVEMAECHKDRYNGLLEYLDDHQ